MLAAVIVAALLVIWRADGSSESTPAGQAIEGAGLEKAIWGPVEMPNGSSAFPTYEQLGVQTFQMQLDWAEVAPVRPDSPRDPSDPAYRWPADLDAAVREAPEHGIRVGLLVTTSPPWANGGRDPIWAPKRTSDFADFLTAATRRYPSVHRWMIWGEPNRSDRFMPNELNHPVGPERYAELLDAAYAALKAGSSENVVIGGMTWTGGDVKPPDFLRWMRLPSGEPPRLDWYGHNPYPFRFPDLANPPRVGGWRDLSDLDTLTTEVDRAYAPLGIRPPLWLSEFTVQSDHPSRYFDYSVSREAQAAWLHAGYRVAEEQGNVAGLGWFTLLDEPEAAGSANWGLMTSNGEEKPSFSAYSEVKP